MKQSFARAALALAVMTLSVPVLAQDYPARPVTILYPNTAGSAGDVMIRAVADKLSAKLKQPFVVDNRPGGFSMIAANGVLAAPHDGYTLYYGGASSLTSVFHKTPPFDFFKAFEPVGGVFVTSYVLAVNDTVPVKTFPELVSYAKANPGKLNFGSYSATATLVHGMLKQAAGLDTVQVTYRGGPQMLTALLANETQLGFDLAQTFRPHVEAGKVRLLAATYEVRDPSAPDVPTTVELGYPNLQAYTVSSIWGPADMPKAAQQRLIDAMKEISSMTDMVARYNAAGGRPLVADAADIRKRTMREAELYANAAKASNFEPPN